MHEPVKFEGKYGPIILSFGTEDPNEVMENLHAVCAAALMDTYKEKQSTNEVKAAI